MWSSSYHVTSCLMLLLSIGVQPGLQLLNRQAVYDNTRRVHDDNNEVSDDWRDILAEAMYEESTRNGGQLFSADAADAAAAAGDMELLPSYNGKLAVVEDWPVNDLELGQIGGLATDNDGYLYVFHRVDRQWTDTSFDDNNSFTKQSDGPIKKPTLYQVNASNGVVLNKYGDNFFYMPHGLTIDRHGNFWTTDVAMHQVFKFEPGKTQPSLTLGKAFQPAKSNSEVDHFCQPTDVAVASNDDFFVSDGYCASRIMKFDKSGHLIGQFGVQDSKIPHSLALAEDLDLICVADRENMRILCYNAGIKDPSQLGEPEREYNDDSLGRVFAISYSSTDGMLYGVTGPTGILVPQGFTIDLREDEKFKDDIIATWSPDDKGFDEPHDITVSPDGELVFVGEIKPDLIWKFVKELN